MCCFHLYFLILMCYFFKKKNLLQFTFEKNNLLRKKREKNNLSRAKIPAPPPWISNGPSLRHLEIAFLLPVVQKSVFFQSVLFVT